MIYRVVSNGILFKVQYRWLWLSIWFDLESFKTMPEAEESVANQLRTDKLNGSGPWTVHAVYDPHTSSDWDAGPTNAERVLRDNK
jgi:hypothetical protein